MKSVWNWLVKSSANPSKVSLMVKGIGTSVVALLMAISGAGGINFDSEVLNQLVDLVATFVNGVLALVGIAITIYGASRKVNRTVKGTNPVL